ncbi:MAG: BT1926 family outer membrane beta-barrel protein [Cyclobacteriaceae bacterium]|nr:BT1926 family outer membrane beta-barrel protein [Cyclobacteriaceae bacterium]
MKKIIIPIFLLLLFAGAGVQAQDEDSGGGGDFAPAAGDISGAIIFGQQMYITSGVYAPNSPYSSSWSVSGQAPYANNVSMSSSITNMVGAEARYFITNNIAAKLSGGAIKRATPARDNIQGMYDYYTPNAGWIPDYQAVEGNKEVFVNINVGGEYHFTSKYDRLYPWAGVTVPFYYGRNSRYNPTVWQNDLNQHTWVTGDSESTSTGELNDPSIIVTDVGPRHTEMVGFGGSAVGGVDYYLKEGFFIGFEIKAISYIYAYSLKYPAPGLESLGADTHTWSFLSQPYFKVGFRF